MRTKWFLLAGAMLIIASASLVAGGAEEAPRGSEQGRVQLLDKSWETFQDEPITLTAFWDKQRDFTEVLRSDALVIEEMTRATGVTLDIRAAVDSSEQSLNLLIASGEYPDFMFVEYGRPAGGALVDDGLLYSFDELADEYGVDMTRYLNPNQLFTQRITFDRPEIYYLNQAGVPASKWDDPLVVRWEIGPMVNDAYYEAIGSPSIESIDDLINAALRAREETGVPYPINVHRQRADRRGLWNEPVEVVRLLAFYGLDDPSNFNNPQGTNHKFYFQTEAFIDLLTDLNRMWDLGLLPPDVWTSTNKRARAFAGEVMFELVNDASNLQSYTLNVQDNMGPDHSFRVLPNFSARPEKYEYSAAGSFGIGEEWAFSIPRNGANPLRALAFLDYIYSDDFQILNWFGLEGEHHTVVDGTPTLIPDFAERLAGMTNEQRAAEYQFNALSSDLRDGYWVNVQRQQNMPEFAAALAGPLAPTIQAFRDTTQVAAAQIASYPPDSEELKIFSNIASVFGDEVARIVVGPADQIEGSYNALMQRIEGMGLAQLNDFQGQYIRDFSDLVARYGE